MDFITSWLFSASFLYLFFLFLGDFAHHLPPLPPPVFHSWAAWLSLTAAAMDDKGSVGKISVSSDSVSTLNSEDFVLVSRLGDETPSSTNNGSDDEKTGLKVRMVGCRYGRKYEGQNEDFRAVLVKSEFRCWVSLVGWHLQWSTHGHKSFPKILLTTNIMSMLNTDNRKTGKQ